MTERSKKMISELCTEAQHIFTKFIENLDHYLGEENYIIFEGKRSIEKQEAYYAQGRKTIEYVNELRKKVGLYALSESENKNRVTWTMNSKHIDGLAMDILPLNNAGNPTWDYVSFKKEFDLIIFCGKRFGLISGSDWEPPDIPHFEYNT